MMCVLLGVAIWLIVATCYGLPVSTTHSCIGGIIGMAVVAKGFKAVNWRAVGGVGLSWIIAPLVSALLSTSIFLVIRRFILRAKNTVSRAFLAYSPIVGFTIALNVFLVLYTSESLQLDLSLWVLILICLAIGAICSLVVQLILLPYIRLHVHSDTDVSLLPVSNENEELEKDKEVESISDKVQISDAVAEIHKNAEQFNPSTEKLFSYLQILTAIFNSFAHGANDVANSIGPFAACIAIYETGNVMADAKVPTMTLVVGGFGIVIGLVCLGYKVMASMGMNMVKVTPSRGFTIEIGSALVILVGSALGLPLSTTHCKVGSTVGVGLVEGKSGVNWSLLYGVFAGWIFTIFICALSTGLVVWIALRFLSILPVCCKHAFRFESKCLIVCFLSERKGFRVVDYVLVH